MSDLITSWSPGELKKTIDSLTPEDLTSQNLRFFFGAVEDFFMGESLAKGLAIFKSLNPGPVNQSWHKYSLEEYTWNKGKPGWSEGKLVGWIGRNVTLDFDRREVLLHLGAAVSSNCLRAVDPENPNLFSTKFAFYKRGGKNVALYTFQRDNIPLTEKVFEEFDSFEDMIRSFRYGTEQFPHETFYYFGRMHL